MQTSRQPDIDSEPLQRKERSRASVYTKVHQNLIAIQARNAHRLRKSMNSYTWNCFNEQALQKVGASILEFR